MLVGSDLKKVVFGLVRGQGEANLKQIEVSRDPFDSAPSILVHFEATPRSLLIGGVTAEHN